MVVAERYGVLPDVVEKQMSQLWFERTLLLMQAESIEARRLTKNAGSGRRTYEDENTQVM